MRRHGGYALIELLMVVLIVGLLASIAIPVFNGQRIKSKNAGAQSTLRTALLAARSFYTTKETFTGFDNDQLNKTESSLSPTGPTVLSPGPTADPSRIRVSVLYGGNGVQLCNASRGNATFCLTFDGKRVYYQVSGGTIAQTGAMGGSSTSWATVYGGANATNPSSYGTFGAPLGDDAIGGWNLNIEAESFMNDCGTLTGGIALICHGYSASTTQTFDTRVSHIRVRAAGVECAEGPIVVVSVDGTERYREQITTPINEDLNWYGVNLNNPLATGSHNVTVAYVNDSGSAGTPPCDRNLYIDKIQFYERGRD